MFAVGQKVYSLGLDSRCLPVVTASIFHEYAEAADENGFDCVIRASGFLLKSRADSLHAEPSELRRQAKVQREAFAARMMEAAR